jgi:hypothetical protein
MARYSEVAAVTLLGFSSRARPRRSSVPSRRRTAGSASLSEAHERTDGGRRGRARSLQRARGGPARHAPAKRIAFSAARARTTAERREAVDLCPPGNPRGGARRRGTPARASTSTLRPTAASRVRSSSRSTRRASLATDRRGPTPDRRTAHHAPGNNYAMHGLCKTACVSGGRGKVGWVSGLGMSATKHALAALSNGLAPDRGVGRPSHPRLAAERRSTRAPRSRCGRVQQAESFTVAFDRDNKPECSVVHLRLPTAGAAWQWRAERRAAPSCSSRKRRLRGRVTPGQGEAPERLRAPGAEPQQHQRRHAERDRRSRARACRSRAPRAWRSRVTPQSRPPHRTAF